MTIAAKYEDGVFKPLEEVTIDEGTIVDVRLPSYIDRLKTKSRPVREFAFYGMWKDPCRHRRWRRIRQQTPA